MFAASEECTGCTTTRVSLTSTGQQSSGGVARPVVSDEARTIAWWSSAADLVPDDTNGKDDVFVRDLPSGSTERVSVSSTGAQANDWSYWPAVSSGGRYVAFYSSATNLAPGDSYSNYDVFIRDRKEGVTELVSAGSGTFSGNPSISGDGRFVSFVSNAALVPDDTNSAGDIYVRDLHLDRTFLASLSSSETVGNGTSSQARISRNGRFVVFASTATNLVEGDTNGKKDVFVRDLKEGTTRRASVASDGSQTNAWTPEEGYPSVSEDGARVVFDSKASNLVSGDTNGIIDVFLHDFGSKKTERVSVGLNGGSTGWGRQPAISAEGKHVVFESGAGDLATNDTNQVEDVFVRDLDLLVTTRASVDSTGTKGHGSQGSLNVNGPAVSSSGRYVVFDSTSPDLVTDDTNAASDVFLRDRQDGAESVMNEPSWLDPFAVPAEQTYGNCGSAFHAVSPTACLSDPVNGATGSYVTSVTDAHMPGVALPFEFVRTYTSADARATSLGRGWTHSYNIGLGFDADGNATLYSETGQQVRYLRQPDGSFVVPDGGRSVLAPTANGYRLTSTNGMSYDFDSGGRLVSLADRNNQSLSLAYDGAGLLTSITDTAGRLVALTYENDLLRTLVLPDGRTTTYGYTNSLLTSVTDMAGGVTRYSYDAGDRVSIVTDQNGDLVVANTYGADGRVVAQDDARGNRTTFSWDSTSGIFAMTDARANVWKDTYKNNILTERKDPLGNRVQYEYDGVGNRTAVTDPRGLKTLFIHDEWGNLLSKRAPSPLSYLESWTYDANNNVTSHRDSRGHETTYNYDQKGNLIEVIEPGGATTSFTRIPANGLVDSVTDAAGAVHVFDYDAEGNLTSSQTPDGGVTTLRYDITGRSTSLVEPRGNVGGANPDDFHWGFAHDALNRVTSVTDPLGHTKSWSYDAAGNVDVMRDQKGHETDYVYVANGLLSKVVAPHGSITSYGYDKVGNLVERTDGNLHTTVFSYDNANRVSGVLSPTRQQWTYTYDRSGNALTMTTPAGNATAVFGDGRISYSYDELNRVKTINYSDTTPDVSFTYDANSNRTSMTDAQGTETYSWDQRGRLASAGRGSAMFSYDYDALGRVTKRNYPDGTTAEQTYTLGGLLESVSSGGRTTRYDYDVAGKLIRTATPQVNGYTESRIYDRVGRLVEVKNATSGTVLSEFRSTLDAVGNPVRSESSGGIATYEYDASDRLTGVCYQTSCASSLDPFIRYDYDAVGNRTSETRPDGIQTYSYNESDQVVSSDGVRGSVTYQHDANGNLTAGGSASYAYDLENRLVTATVGGSTTEYSYDGDGIRLKATSDTLPTPTTDFSWDRNWSVPRLVRESDGNGDLLRRYVYGHRLSSLTTGGLISNLGSEFYYHFDGLGSVTNVTTADGIEVAGYEYDPFGGKRGSDLNLLGPHNPMRFTGEYLDPTGLYHLRARQYDSVLGRFTAVDPATAAITDSYVSSYVYVNNRPTVLIDPTGLTGTPASCGEQVARGVIDPSGYPCIPSVYGTGVGYDEIARNVVNGGIAVAGAVAPVCGPVTKGAPLIGAGVGAAVGGPGGAAVGYTTGQWVAIVGVGGCPLIGYIGRLEPLGQNSK